MYLLAIVSKKVKRHYYLCSSAVSFLILFTVLHHYYFYPSKLYSSNNIITSILSMNRSISVFTSNCSCRKNQEITLSKKQITNQKITLSGFYNVRLQNYLISDNQENSNSDYRGYDVTEQALNDLTFEFTEFMKP